MRRGRPSPSFAPGLGVAVAFGLLLTGMEVVFTLLSVPGVVELAAALSPASLFSWASVAAFVSAASSSKAAAFLLGFGDSSSGPSAIWKLIWVPNRGLSAR